MTREEFAIIASGMKTMYKREGFLDSAESMSVWYELLKDLTYKQVSVAVQKYMLTKKFAPTVAEIRELCVPKKGDWSDGWEQVVRAIKKFGVYDPEGAYAFMDDTTRKAVKRLGWQEICLSENLTADRANFRIVYEQIESRHHEEAVLPESIKERIEKIDALMIEQGEWNDGTQDEWNN